MIRWRGIACGLRSGEHWQTGLQCSGNGEREPVAGEVAGSAGDVVRAVVEPGGTVVRIVAGVGNEQTDDAFGRLPAISWQAQVNPREKIGTIAGPVQHLLIDG